MSLDFFNFQPLGKCGRLPRFGNAFQAEQVAAVVALMAGLQHFSLFPTPPRLYLTLNSDPTKQDYLAKMHTDLDFVSKALGKDAPTFGRGKAEATWVRHPQRSPKNMSRPKLHRFGENRSAWCRPDHQHLAIRRTLNTTQKVMMLTLECRKERWGGRNGWNNMLVQLA